MIDMRQSIMLLLFVTVTGTMFYGCSKENQQTFTIEGKGKRIIVNNDLLSLNSRISYFSDYDFVLNDTIQKKNYAPSAGNQKAVVTGFSLKLRAEVNPLEYNGHILRATSVTVEGDYAWVTYNTEGDIYLGGVEVLDIKDTSHPHVISQAVFTDTDISALSVDNGKLYLAEACDLNSNPSMVSPASLEVMQLDSGRLTANTQRVELESFTANDVVVSGNNVYVTTGSTGGLFVINKLNLQIIDKYSIDDARSIDADDSYVAVLRGNPGTVFLLNSNDRSVIKSIVTGGAAIPESKSEVRVSCGLLYTALNDEGMKIIRISDGSVVASQPRPSGPEGSEAGDYVTNSVSLNNSVGFNMVLTANGAAGVWIHDLSGKLKLQLIGTMDFQSSTNFVESKGCLIYVATGFGGLKIIELNESKPSCRNHPADTFKNTNLQGLHIVKYHESRA